MMTKKIIKRRDERDLSSDEEDEVEYDEEFLEEIRKELADHEILHRESAKTKWNEYLA